MKEQMEMEQLSQIVEQEQEEKIKVLEAQLADAQKSAETNKVASDILNDMLGRGEVKQNDDGSIEVVQGPNYVANRSDVEM